jgi:uncharacterized coiled-coil DUF342 family protein
MTDETKVTDQPEKVELTPVESIAVENAEPAETVDVPSDSEIPPSSEEKAPEKVSETSEEKAAEATPENATPEKKDSKKPEEKVVAETVEKEDAEKPEEKTEAATPEEPEKAEATSEKTETASAEPEAKKTDEKADSKADDSPEAKAETAALLKQLDVIKKDVQELKGKVALANRKKEQAFKKKQEVSKKIGERISELLGSKKERNSLTGEVQKLKQERDKLNKQIREKVQEIKKMNEEHKDVVGQFDKKNNPAALEKQIEQMEYKLETQPMSFDAEQKLNKKIKELKKQFAGVKDTAIVLTDLREKSKEIDRLKREANKYHRQVQEHAQNSQNKHESLISESKEIDDMKKEEDTLYKAFLEEKTAYLEINNQLKEKVAALQKIKESLNQRNVKLKEDQKKEEMKSLKERAAEAEEKVKKKQKLTTEDLLAMQGIKK